MVKLEWGTKRVCLNCGTRFYDLQNPTPSCPSCQTVFEVHPVTKGRRGKAAALDLSKDLLLDDLTNDLDLTGDLDSDLDDGLIDDADDLNEGLNDIPDVLNGTSDD